ncbi:MAG: hypothetical protein FJ109_13070 [Deltaproteobacteria bacterium]|nr:hypothetical protein [Deltaproteobacteria bacterium]
MSGSWSGASGLVRVPASVVLGCALLVSGCSKPGGGSVPAEVVADLVEDAAPTAPDRVEEAEPETTFSLLSPCQTDAECPGGLCVAGPTGRVCTVPCGEACPVGLFCATAALSPSETIKACVPRGWEICRPCSSSTDCGIEGDLCIEFGGGTWCGLGCETAADCPPSHACMKFPSVDFDVLVTQCVPVSLTCDCRPQHVGSGRVCSVKNEFGECPGEQFCQTGGGWTQCMGKTPEEELCNAVDDDCDDTADEGFPDNDLDGMADCVDWDVDGDGIEFPPDNCPESFNPLQEDIDGDSYGDSCDPDDDNDGWPDFYDCRPFDPDSYPGAEEINDYADNNCNGAVDEGPGEHVYENCGPGCHELGAGPGQGTPFDLDEEHAKGLGTDDKGYLLLKKGVLQFPSIWIANSPENTVSRLDTDTGKEKSRHKVCFDPSRTAVDLDGNVWVACRGDGHAVKILLSDVGCPDKDGDGVVETSEDKNGDGKVTGTEVLPAGQDECIKFSVLPAGASLLRGAGVDKDNHAWVADWNAMKLFRLEPDGGGTVQTIPIPDNPYGLAIDSSGIIWVSGRGQNMLIRVDPATGGVQTLTPDNGGWQFAPYGIGVDGLGRIWVASCFSESKVHRYDPAADEWKSVTVPGYPRGIAANAEGKTFAALDSAGAVAIIDQETMALDGTVSLGGWKNPVGISIDHKGFVWAVNQSGNSATKIDPLEKKILGEYPVGGGPYTYSDMTGYQLITFVTPSGFYRHTFSAEGLPAGIWSLVSVDYLATANGWIAVSFRAADTEEELAGKEWHPAIGPYPPEEFPLDLSGYPDAVGLFLEVKVHLHVGDGGISPLIKKIEVQHQTD